MWNKPACASPNCAENDEFAIALSRLSDIENKGTVPTIYRLYSLCAIYRLDMAEVLEWYGVDLAMLPADAAALPLEQHAPAGLRARDARRSSGAAGGRIQGWI